MSKRTKIIATVGPACSTPTMLAQLINAGVDCFRLNLSHGDHASHLASLRLIRAAETASGRPIGVLADLQGPKIRTGKLKDGQPVEWPVGFRTVLTVDAVPEGTAERVESTYKLLHHDVKAGSTLLVDDGKMRLRVERVDGHDVHCVVEAGGWLKNSKGINLPGVQVSAPALSEKDIRDLAWACANGCDLVALSFVHSHHDCLDLRRRIAAHDCAAGIVAKVELPEAVEDIDAIARECDAVMVARGDLGIEISPEWLPMVQKDLIRATNRQGRIAITATQMLESMIEVPMPTRAETTDIANAIIDGTDTVMLSGETASGKFPLEAVEAMARISLVAEGSPYLVHVDADLDRPESAFPLDLLALTRAALALADGRHAAAIIVADPEPLLVRLLSERRGRTPIIAACRDAPSARRLVLYWGVIPLEIGPALLPTLARCRERGLLSAGDDVVVLERHPRDALTVHRVG